MKSFILIILIFVSILITSCGRGTRKDYTMGEDGLIYRYGSNRLFNGKIVDTANVVIQYGVINGKKNGLFITHYLNGHIEKFGFIENNMNEGEWKYFYPNGNLESSGRFTDNKAVGRWTFYYPNGIIKTEGNYFNNEKEGRWILYNHSGEIVNILFFRNGEFITIQNRIS